MIRISTAMIYDAGVGTMNRQTAGLLHLQQQVANGRRILTPSDDPVNAARALVVEQSRSATAQFSTTIENANSVLGLEEVQLTSVNDIFARIKELTVQAGNAALSKGDRESIAFELRARFDELLGIANAADGQGLYLFSGYMGATQPFGGTVEYLNAAPGNEMAYFGDDGERRLQVASTRYIEISDSGRDVFMNIRNGNGSFVTDYARDAGGNSTNTGSGVIDAGRVTDPAAWDALANKPVRIVFTSATAYDIVDATAATIGSGTYQSGQPVAIPGGGASVTITGAPANGDSFTLAPSTTRSVFKTLAGLIETLESGITSDADRARYVNEIGFALRDFEQADDNILRVRAMIGSRLSELDSLASVNADLELQYQQTLSSLQDLDYAKAISDLTRKQTDLQAAQQSFSRISQLTLFDYIR